MDKISQVKQMRQSLQPILPSTSSDEAWQGRGNWEDKSFELDESNSGPLFEHVHALHQASSCHLLSHQVGLFTPNGGFFHDEAQDWRVNLNTPNIEDISMIYSGATTRSFLKKALTTQALVPRQCHEIKGSSFPESDNKLNLENDSFQSKDIKSSKLHSFQEATFPSSNRNSIEENPISTSTKHSIRNKNVYQMAPLQARADDFSSFGRSSPELSSFSESDDEYATSTPCHLINYTHVKQEDSLGSQVSSSTKMVDLHAKSTHVSLENVGKGDKKSSTIQTSSLESVEEMIGKLKTNISDQLSLSSTTLQKYNQESNMEDAINLVSTKKGWSYGSQDLCNLRGEVGCNNNCFNEYQDPSRSLQHLTSSPNAPIQKDGQDQQQKYWCHTKPTIWKRGEMLGEGAYGKVFAGLNQTTGEFMAVKQLKLDNPHDQSKEKDDHLKALQREIDLYKTMKHKHIVRYIGMDEDEESGSLYIFLEYVSGGSIQSMLEQFGPFNEQLVQVYTRQLLLGLEYLHGKNLVHRDIKGGNVLVDAHGVIKLADFGASKLIATAQLLHDAFETNGLKSIRGSVFWMAPEVIKGDGYGRRADIWSLGCTVIEMMTGMHPWPDLDNTWSAIFHIAKTQCGPPLPKGSSDCAKDFLGLCFTLNPKQRPTASKLLTHPFVCEPLICQDPSHLLHP